MADRIRIVVATALLLVLLLVLPLRSSVSFPLSGDETVLP